jgi:hypothetical protein
LSKSKKVWEKTKKDKKQASEPIFLKSNVYDHISNF